MGWTGRLIRRQANVETPLKFLSQRQIIFVPIVTAPNATHPIIPI
jgi:hypothetical protein